jgi:hypothetical protein
MPGGPDRGQPTSLRNGSRGCCRTRSQGLGDKALTWTLTANGHTEKVVAKLLPAYEKDETSSRLTTALAKHLGK